MMLPLQGRYANVSPLSGLQRFRALATAAAEHSGGGGSAGTKPAIAYFASRSACRAAGIVGNCIIMHQTLIQLLLYHFNDYFPS
jgi:hypothetical protein